MKGVFGKILNIKTIIIWIFAVLLLFFGMVVPIIGAWLGYLALFLFLGEAKYIGLDVVGWFNKLFDMYAGWRNKMK